MYVCVYSFVFFSLESDPYYIKVYEVSDPRKAQQISFIQAGYSWARIRTLDKKLLHYKELQI